MSVNAIYLAGKIRDGQDCPAEKGHLLPVLDFNDAVAVAGFIEERYVK